MNRTRTTLLQILATLIFGLVTCHAQDNSDYPNDGIATNLEGERIGVYFRKPESSVGLSEQLQKRAFLIFEKSEDLRKNNPTKLAAIIGGIIVLLNILYFHKNKVLKTAAVLLLLGTALFIYRTGSQTPVKIMAREQLEENRRNYEQLKEDMSGKSYPDLRKK